MRKKRSFNMVATVRLVSWIFEIILAGLFLYAFVTLTDMIPLLNVRIAVTILAFPFLASFWVACCIAITLIRERWILDDY